MSNPEIEDLRRRSSRAVHGHSRVSHAQEVRCTKERVEKREAIEYALRTGEILEEERNKTTERNEKTSKGKPLPVLGVPF